LIAILAAKSNENPSPAAPFPHTPAKAGAQIERRGTAEAVSTPLLNLDPGLRRDERDTSAR